MDLILSSSWKWLLNICLEVTCNLKIIRKYFCDYYFHSMQVFHASFNGWFFTKVWGILQFSQSLFPRPLKIVPRAPTIIGIIITFMFNSLFSSLVRSKYMPIFILSFIFICCPLEWQNSLDVKVLFWSSGLGFGNLFVSQNPRESYGSHFLREILVCAYTIF